MKGFAHYRYLIIYLTLTILKCIRTAKMES